MLYLKISGLKISVHSLKIAGLKIIARVCVYACMRVIYYLYQPMHQPNHLNVKQNIIELMKVKVLARVKYSAYLCK